MNRGARRSVGVHVPVCNRDHLPRYWMRACCVGLQAFNRMKTFTVYKLAIV